MIKNKKRWLASALTLAITLSECGSFRVLAEEEAIAATESSISENSAAARASAENDEDIPTDAEPLSETSGTDTELKLPALHIGQIPEGEKLPASDEDTFVYDLPVTPTTAESLILFSNYTIEGLPETAENGTLEWSILRGEKGLPEGSASLLDAADDWEGFEEVSSSPCFTLETIEDKDSEYGRMMRLTPGGMVYDETYDYYIRAAYFAKTEERDAEGFYAAATVSFVPMDAPDTENTETVSENDILRTETVSSNDLLPEISVSENNTVYADEEISVISPDAVIPAEETALDPATESLLSSPSENSITADASIPAVNSETPFLEEKADFQLTLYRGTEIAESNILDGNTSVYLNPKDTQQITAKLVPETSPVTILWESSDDTVATVKADTSGNGTATVTAVAEGFARITASYRGITASVTVDVVKDKIFPDNDKLLDLSGDIRVAGFKRESDELVYNGQKITQDFRVYHKNTLLTEKVDYILSYRNNINAAAWNSSRAPSVTITLRGQYQGSVTLYYTIKPLDINHIDIYNSDTAADGSGTAVKKSPGYEQTVNYSKKLSIPAPALTYGRKKLAAKRDFICDYMTPGENLTPLPADYSNGDLYEAGKVYSYTVNGVGNFKGSFPMTFIVLKDKNLNFSSASIKLDQTKYEYHGTPLSTQDVKITEVKIGGKALPETLYSYAVAANGTEGAYVTVSPSEAGRNQGYRGCKKMSLKIVGDRQIKDTVPGKDWLDTIPYSQKTVNKDGGMFQTGDALLAFEEAGNAKALVEGTDYTIKYGNAKKVGRVTVTFRGMGRYTGSVTKHYMIVPDVSNLTIVWGENVTVKADGSLEIPYQKNGAVPQFAIRDENYVVLNSKTDYSVQVKDNKKPKAETQTDMTCTIKGKGNYRGYEKAVSLTVTKADIGNASLTVSDKVYDAKPNRWKSAVTVTDTNGKKLGANTDYVKEIEYSYASMGTTTAPPVGTVVTVKVTGTGFYEGTLTGTYRIYDKTKAISKLVIDIDPQTYTGEEIKLEKSAVHVYASNADKKAKRELADKNACFEIVESTYKNNSKAGTAKVTLHGIGPYGGTKACSFKIQKKQYLINHVKEITLDKSTLSLSLAETNEEKKKITATITAESEGNITNPTVVWTSSNSSIVDIGEVTANLFGKDSAGRATASSTVTLTLRGAGSATITATAQDSGRKAQCKITVLEAAPILVEADTTIQKNIGETYQLHMSFSSEQLTWESSNSEAVSVDKKGLLTMKKAGAAVITAVYRSQSNDTFTQQCYAVAIDPSETKPTGNILTYEQKPGTTDDTSAINALLDSYNPDSYEALYIPAGVYHIDTKGPAEGLGGIYMHSNQKLIMSSSALVMAIENSYDGYQIINVNASENVTIIGGQIVGDRQKHTGKGGEAGHGIQIWGSRNVTVKNVDVSQCWGDGIYLGWSNGMDSSDITIENCVLHHNRRSNLSITEANNITVKNCAFNYASGTDPQYGINIEPNHNKSCGNITISNSTFRGNAHGTIQILGQVGGKIDGVTIENCTGDKAPLLYGNYSNVVQNNNKWG